MTIPAPRRSPDTSPPRVLTEAEATALLDAADREGPATAALIGLQLHEGLRVLEAARLTHLDVDLEAGIVRLASWRVEDSDVALGPRTAAALRRLVAQRTALGLSGPLFVGAGLEDREIVWKTVETVRACAAAAGLQGITVHMLQATATRRADATRRPPR